MSWSVMWGAVALPTPLEVPFLLTVGATCGATADGNPRNSASLAWAAECSRGEHSVQTSVSLSPFTERTLSRVPGEAQQG